MHEWPIPALQAVWRRAEDAPIVFQPLARRIFEADAFILVTPEYNGSYTSALKNLLDHFPKQYRKAFGLVTASQGALGGMPVSYTNLDVYKRQPMSRSYFNVYYPSQFMGYENYSVPTQEGTVTVSMIDAKTDKTVWQGWPTDEIDSRRIKSKEVQAAVKSIFRKFDLAKN